MISLPGDLLGCALSILITVMLIFMFLIMLTVKLDHNSCRTRLVQILTWFYQVWMKFIMTLYWMIETNFWCTNFYFYVSFTVLFMQRKRSAQMHFEMKHSNVLIHLTITMVSITYSLISLASHSTCGLVRTFNFR